MVDRRTAKTQAMASKLRASPVKSGPATDHEYDWRRFVTGRTADRSADSGTAVQPHATCPRTCAQVQVSPIHLNEESD